MFHLNKESKWAKHLEKGTQSVSQRLSFCTVAVTVGSDTEHDTFSKQSLSINMTDYTGGSTLVDLCLLVLSSSESKTETGNQTERDKMRGRHL